jgi:hypothetical protein
MFKKTSFIIILIIFIVAEAAINMQQAIAKVYGNEKFGYTVSYPDHWYPSRLRYANEFEIRRILKSRQEIGHSSDDGQSK